MPDSNLNRKDTMSTKKGNFLELAINDLNEEGKGVARAEDGLVVFVDWAVPGDIVKAEIVKAKGNYALGKITGLLKLSERRTEPRCQHFGVCNGCKSQNLVYAEQLRIKREHVKNAFEKIGGFKTVTPIGDSRLETPFRVTMAIPEAIGCEEIYFYRNKLEFSFSTNAWLSRNPEVRIQNGFALGYHMPKFIDKVLDIEKCYLQSEVSNRILNLTRDFFKQRGTSIYSFKTHSGYLRYLVVRNSEYTGEILVNLITSYQDSVINDYAEHLQKEVSEVSTLTNSISTTKAQAAISNYYKTIFGNGYIEENLGNYKFRITPNIFFQTNSKQAKVLFDTVVKMAEFEANERVLDLYCGSGAIALYISEYVDQVTGVESNAEAIKSAMENAELNGVRNCEFVEHDVKEYLKTQLPRASVRGSMAGSHAGFSSKRIDTIILDPPRSGLHPKAIECLLELQPKKIVYVSCNPATQARDLKGLAEKYNMMAIQPVDMFPHTMHVENVAKLVKR
jgi:23S rRNA (uracil1939-C5)-methyltransferase